MSAKLHQKDLVFMSLEDYLFNEMTQSLTKEIINQDKISDQSVASCKRTSEAPLDPLTLNVFARDPSEVIDKDFSQEGERGSKLLNESEDLPHINLGISRLSDRNEEEKTPTPIISNTCSSPKTPRPDIENRKILRVIRKLYSELLFYHNDKLKNKRFTNIKYSVLLEALTDMCSIYMPEVPAEEMGQFMFMFLNIHSQDKCTIKTKAARAGKKAFECSHKYKSSKFEALLDFMHFRLLITSFWKLKDTSLEDLLVMKSQISWPNQYNFSREKYTKLIKKCLDPKILKSLEPSISQLHKECLKSYWV
ncbi:unnamed protein product [Moneuplotes crassus]|uniref:Uncharacterized protein n=1 Tax=Euplotes crassus TaxID=5936 RepID=A0AAD1Y548_EUPCR|nr:unnamed protein product [Moneuplotes crassus]